MRYLSLLLALMTLALASATLGKHVRNGDARDKPEKVDGVAAGAWGSESEAAETSELAEEVRGTSYSRLQNLRAQLLNGLPLRLVALGGSSTAGHVLRRDSPLLYYGRLAGWVNESYPHVETLVVNSGTPASGPTYMEKCLTSQLPPEPNLVLVEYSQNCGTREDGLALERLLRRLLQLASAPAIVYVALPTWGELKHGVNATRPCPYDAELAAHYGVPLVRPSFPRSYAELSRLFSEPVSKMDGAHAAHPTADGHALVAAALRRLFSKAWGTPPEKGRHRARQPPPLPSPCYSRDASVRHSEQVGNRWQSTVTIGGAKADRHSKLTSPSEPNYELPSSLCMSGAELAPYVLPSTKGFHPVVEGSKLHPKPGYVAMHGGARLSLCYNLSVACVGDGAGGPRRCPPVGEVLLGAIGYLQSYAPEMGDAKLTCDGGCSCNDDGTALLNGWHASKTSVTWVSWLALRLRAPLEAAGSACPCTVHVTTQRRQAATLQGKGSPQGNGSHATGPVKFKVNMLMLTHDGRMDWIDPWKVKTLAVGDTRRA